MKNIDYKKVGIVLVIICAMGIAIYAAYFKDKGKQQLPQMPMQSDIAQHEIDFEKIKTIEQLKNVVYAMVGGKLYVNVRKDSLSDHQIDEKLKELYK